jgi:hypothetical protein
MDRDDLRSKIYLKDIIENFDFKISNPLIGQELATSLGNKRDTLLLHATIELWRLRK